VVDPPWRSRCRARSVRWLCRWPARPDGWARRARAWPARARRFRRPAARPEEAAHDVAHLLVAEPLVGVHVAGVGLPPAWLVATGPRISCSNCLASVPPPHPVIRASASHAARATSSVRLIDFSVDRWSPIMSPRPGCCPPNRTPAPSCPCGSLPELRARPSSRRTSPASA
jgi:hypothetical protein